MLGPCCAVWPAGTGSAVGVGPAGLLLHQPDMCNDTHDCPISTGDDWLSREVPRILGSPAFTTQNSLLVVTWDEGSKNDNRVATVFAGPAARKGFTSNAAYSHYSLLHTIEDVWGLAPLTDNVRNAPLMSDCSTPSGQRAFPGQHTGNAAHNGPEAPVNRYLTGASPRAPGPAKPLRPGSCEKGLWTRAGRACRFLEWNMAGSEVIEVEHKYSPSESDAVPRLASIQGVDRVGQAVSEQLDAVYFDTEALALAARRITLRRRSGGPDAGWHLKLPVAAGERREIAEPLGGDQDAVPERLAPVGTGSHPQPRARARGAHQDQPELDSVAGRRRRSPGPVQRRPRRGANPSAAGGTVAVAGMGN